MNSTKMIVATTLVALIGVGSAFAQEGTQDFPAQAMSKQSRSDIRNELGAARSEGSVSYREASPAPVAASTLTRRQVMAETKEAMRLGLVGTTNEGQLRIATPAEQEAIRQAGLRAIDNSIVQAAR